MRKLNSLGLVAIAAISVLSAGEALGASANVSGTVGTYGGGALITVGGACTGGCTTNAAVNGSYSLTPTLSSGGGVTITVTASGGNSGCSFSGTQTFNNVKSNDNVT